MRAMLVLVVGCCLLAGCTSNGSVDSTGPAVTTTGAPTTAGAPTTSAEPTGTTASTSNPESTEPSTVPEPVGTPYFEGLLVTPISLLVPTEGVGERPLLAWDPLDGVARYELYVFTESGRLYWGWSTTDSNAFVGGIEPTPAGLRAPGPRIQPGMTWAVLGFDEDGMLVAQSERRPIAP